MPLWRHAMLLIALCSIELLAQPVTPEDFLARAEEHFSRRRFFNALDSLQVVLQMTEHENARTNVTKLQAEILAARALAALDRREEAANMYERAVAHGYEDKSALAYLGAFFTAHGKWQKARTYLAEYFARDKSDAETHIRYAVVLARLQERAQAKEVLAAIEPTGATQKIEECDLLERQKKFREAYACFVLYRNSHPDREVGYLALYRTAQRLNDRTKAAQAAETLYWLFGDDVRYVWPLIEVRIAQRKFYDARVLLESVVRAQGGGNDSDAARLLANLKRDAPEAVKRPYRATLREMRFLENNE